MSSKPAGGVVVNQSYAGQRVTGQQRYAAEVSRRLLAHPSFAGTVPEGPWATSTLRTWAWVQLALPVQTRSDVLLSMTSRAPVMHRRQVLVVHDLFVLTNPEWFSPSYHRTHAPLLRAQLRLATAVVAVSEATADDVSTIYSRSLVVAPNAPSSVFTIDESKTELSLSALTDLAPGSYFLAVGSQEPRKNLARLAEAYGLLDPEIRRAHPLVVVGASNPIYQEEQIPWPVETRVMGYVSDDELRELYAAAAAVVLVSLAEGFGLPLVEAAASGTGQLVLSDIPVFRWIAGDEAHFVDPLDVTSICDGLRQALQTSRPHDIDLARFDWDASALAVRDLCLEHL
ncbi:glycosyltransferase family 1 protein [Lapillicoccus sp.]|uniref:glycosyltransferase family 4 protein n=1 Tax=Lapillicoccus sp. TaxID=1909287 RepID=UPI0025CCAA5B|nr:glycosyltransferase family 1 protein [Lapillicoccus sp.]